MSFIKSFFKGFLILIFLPFYWLYTIIWFIAFRGKLNDYPRVKKDATAKHLILAAISLFVFAIFGSASSNTSTKEATNEVALKNTYMETAEFLESETKSTQEDIYTSLIDNTSDQAPVETASSKSSNDYDTDYELSDEDISNYESSGGISPYYHPSIEEDSYSDYYESSDYESSGEFGNNYYEQTIEEDSDYKPSVKDTNSNITNSTSTDSNNSNNDYNFNIYNNTEQQNTTMSWVLNTNSHIIHYPECSFVAKMAPKNYATSNESLSVLQSNGYKLHKNCPK